MVIFGLPSWISFFLCGAIAIILSWLTTGCRVGDYVEQQPQPQPSNSDHYSGYYVTQPQTLTLYVTTDQTHQGTASLSLIPSDISAIMTNPVALILQDASTGSAQLVSPSNTTQALPTTINSNNTLSYSATTQPSTYWQDPACQSYLEFSESGILNQTSNVTIPPGNTYSPILGEIQLTFQMVTKFNGNCGPTFQTLANCYQDPSQCGGTDSASNLQLQSQVTSLLGPFIQSQVISPPDIAKIVNYAFEFAYQ